MNHPPAQNLRIAPPPTLRGGDGVVLPDYTDPFPEIRTSIVIDAPPDRVCRALIDPAALNTWIASAADVEPHVGGRYSYGWTHQHGGRDVTGGPTRILEIVPNERLVPTGPIGVATPGNRRRASRG